MTTLGKLMALEALSGIFGWIWIIASIAAIYYFISAVIFSGAWSSFFLAFGVGVISKWLCRGFLANKQRVAAKQN